MRSFRILGAVALLLSLAAWTQAATTFNVTMTGAAEVSNAGVLGVGDPDALGVGTITLDPDLDKISWHIEYTNVDGTALTGFHIHGPDATLITNKPVYQNLGFSPSTPPSGMLMGEVTNVGAQIDTILANPGGFYLNLHSSAFPAGAIRGQLPEPASLGLLGLGAMALLRRRRPA